MSDTPEPNPKSDLKGQIDTVYAALRTHFDDCMKTPVGREYLRLELANLQGVPRSSVLFGDEVKIKDENVTYISPPKNTNT